MSAEFGELLDAIFGVNPAATSDEYDPAKPVVARRPERHAGRNFHRHPPLARGVRGFADLTLAQEITKRAHHVEPQGDGIYMVLIRLDEIVAAVRAFNRSKKPKKHHCKRK